jgi:hypothetical protein
VKSRKNVTLNDDGPIDAGIKIDIYYSFDEEGGYYIDTDSMREEFEERLSEIEDDISNLNHERDDHLRTKHMEFPEKETNGVEL